MRPKRKELDAVDNYIFPLNHYLRPGTMVKVHIGGGGTYSVESTITPDIRRDTSNVVWDTEQLSTSTESETFISTPITAVRVSVTAVTDAADPPVAEIIQAGVTSP